MAHGSPDYWVQYNVVLSLSDLIGYIVDLIDVINSGTNPKLDAAVTALTDGVEPKLDSVATKLDTVSTNLTGGVEPKLDSIVTKLDTVSTNLTGGVEPKLDSVATKLDTVATKLDAIITGIVDGTNTKLDTTISHLADSLDKLDDIITQLVAVNTRLTFSSDITDYSNNLSIVPYTCQVIMHPESTRMLWYCKNQTPNMILNIYFTSDGSGGIVATINYGQTYQTYYQGYIAVRADVNGNLFWGAKY